MSAPMSSTDPKLRPARIPPAMLAEAAQARLAAENAAQHVELVCLRIAVRLGLPDGASWDASGVITYPPPAPERGEPIPTE